MAPVRLLEWYVQVVAVVIAVSVFLIAHHAWNTIHSQESKAIGKTGETGSQGFIGPRGVRGLLGPKGPTGVTGPTGGTGPAGNTGYTALPGQTGVTGLQGVVGLVGPTIFTGPTGATGFVGFASTTGPTGPASNPNFTGATGSTGPTGLTVLPSLLVSYTMPTHHLTVADTPFVPPLTYNSLMQQVQLIDNSLGAFTFNDGGITFAQTSSTTVAYNVRISISGHITGGNSLNFAHLSFPGLPISTNAVWNVGADYCVGSGVHLFSATLIDTVSPLTINYNGNLSFHCFIDNTFSSQNSYLTISLLIFELSQLSI